MKKLLSLFLASAMLVSAFAACTTSKTESSDKEDSKDSSVAGDESKDDEGSDEIVPVDISILFQDGGTDPYQEDWALWSILKDNAGINIDVTAVPSADYETKKSLLINTGDVPDIITNSFPTLTQISSGLFMACDEMEANLPNYVKFIEDNDLREGIDRRKCSDGHYYSLPCQLTADKYQPLAWQARADIFEKNNLKIPTNLDELYEVGVELKKIYPDSAPLSNRFTSNSIMSGISAGFGTTAGWTYEDGAHYDADTDSFVFAATTQNWKDMLIYTNKLYEAGVLDQEFSTLESTIYEQKVVQGETFILHNYFGGMVNFNRDGAEVDPDFKIIPINSLAGTADYADEYAVGWCNNWTASWMISSAVADRDDYEAFCTALDWLYTEDGMLLSNFGTEDMYETNEFGLLESTLPDDGNSQGLGNNSMTALKHPDKVYTGLGEDAALLEAVYDHMAANDVVDDPRPMSPLTIEQSEEFSVTTTNLSDYVKSCMESFIFGTMTMDDWDEFVAQCEAKGCNDLVDAYNEAWAAKA